MTKFLEALAVFTSTIVGAGIFGLPYIAFKSGFGVVIFYFLVLVILAIIVHLLLAEVSRNTQKICRIPGYAEEYLGKNWRNFSLIVSSLGLLGALLAYLILGGNFLASYFGGSAFLYTILFFIFGAILIYKGIKGIAKIDLIMLVVIIFILFLFLVHGLPFFNFKNLITFNPQFLAFPYGAVLFSLWGLTLVPEIKEMTERDRKKLRQVIISGIILAGLCYLSFIFIILGVSGSQTSPDALSGFAKIIGEQAVRLGFIFGILTVFTSFLGLGLTLKKILQYDLKLPEKTSWAVACFLPLLLYLLGINNFIGVISVTGAAALGLEAVIVIFIYKKYIEKRFQRKTPIWIYPLAAFFLIGLVLQLFSPILFK
ncbi:MAG: aromatic amino acid transport family protein [bacterium]|nr:aromatic amino acid transport family protein [bacterium]